MENKIIEEKLEGFSRIVELFEQDYNQCDEVIIRPLDDEIGKTQKNVEVLFDQSGELLRIKHGDDIIYDNV